MRTASALVSIILVVLGAAAARAVAQSGSPNTAAGQSGGTVNSETGVGNVAPVAPAPAPATSAPAARAPRPVSAPPPPPSVSPAPISSRPALRRPRRGAPKATAKTAKRQGGAVKPAKPRKAETGGEDGEGLVAAQAKVLASGEPVTSAALMGEHPDGTGWILILVIGLVAGAVLVELARTLHGSVRPWGRGRRDYY
jgi:hypothetical protein